MALIFFFSAETGPDSSSRSLVFAQWFVDLGIFVDIDHASLFVRKSAHFAVYLVLGILAFRVADLLKMRLSVKVIVSLVFAALYAMSDELHQLIVADRAGTFTDVLLDTAGAAVGILAYSVIAQRHAARGKKQARE